MQYNHKGVCTSTATSWWQVLLFHSQGTNHSPRPYTRTLLGPICGTASITRFAPPLDDCQLACSLLLHAPIYSHTAHTHAHAFLGVHDRALAQRGRPETRGSAQTSCLHAPHGPKLCDTPSLKMHGRAWPANQQRKSPLHYDPYLCRSLNRQRGRRHAPAARPGRAAAGTPRARTSSKCHCRGAAPCSPG